jgi:hypothetical protein
MPFAVARLLSEVRAGSARIQYYLKPKIVEPNLRGTQMHRITPLYVA